MRLARFLLPVLILLAAGGVGLVYSSRKAAEERSKPAPPKALPAGVASQANEFVWSQTVEGRVTVEVRAANTQQVGERTEMDGVELKLYHKDGKAFDRVRSAKAHMVTSEAVLRSDGDVEITMGLPAGEEPQAASRLLTIRSSGVSFDARTGKASTAKPASFTFDRGEGQATGAEYDPSTRELRMHSDVRLRWNARTPQEKTMEVSAGALVYKEAESKVYLSPWSKLHRATLDMQAGDAVITLKDGVIENVETVKAAGVDRYSDRTLEFGADSLRMKFHANGEMENVVGENQARLTSLTPSSRTAVTAQRLEMQLDPSESGSQLQKATANGGSVVETRPVVQTGSALADTRILRSESIAMIMRPGGAEIEQVETHSPGQIEFIPNQKGRRRRLLNGDRMWIAYAPANQIEKFRAVSVTTRSEPPEVTGRPPSPPMITSSRDLTATFEPATGEMTRLEQWNDFRYEEGPRKASSERATLETASDEILLEGAARVWDDNGSTAAKKILLRQQTGEFEASGNVASTRKPEKKKDAGGMLAPEEPMQAKADRMLSRDKNQVIRYLGNSLLWQGSNRLQADEIEIDRARDSLAAGGSVVSQLLDKQPAAGASVYTVVRSARLDYSGKSRIAHYSGGASLQRPGMDVTAREIRAHLNEGGKEQSKLDKAFADGTVKIVQSAAGRTRTGTSDHAEYYTGEERVVLSGGQPLLVDSVKGSTRGRRLTYFAGNDKLLVDGGEKAPAVSRIRRN